MFMQLENVLYTEKLALFRYITLNTLKISLILQGYSEHPIQHKSEVLPGLYTGLISDRHLLLFV